MTREEARNILGEGASENQVTNMLNNVQLITKDYQEKIDNLETEKQGYETKINNFQTKLDETSKYKIELDNIKKANMTEQEQLELQKKETQRLLDEAKVISNKAKVKEILAGEGISDEQIASLVDKDETVSIDRANMLKSVLTSTKEAVEKKVKGELASIPVEPKLSNVTQSSDKMSLDKFLDMSAEEQEKFANDHTEEYNSLINN